MLYDTALKKSCIKACSRKIKPKIQCADKNVIQRDLFPIYKTRIPKIRIIIDGEKILHFEAER